MRTGLKSYSRWQRFLSLLPILTLLAAALSTTGPAIAQDQAASPEEQLADRYAPFAALRDQEAPCDHSGEGYFPAPVDLVLGNPEVTLWQDVEGTDVDELIMEAPTAQDLAGLDDTYYLNFPGNPNNPGCTYETTFKRYASEAGAEPTTYAHVIVDRLRARVVVQYWFWYYFNDWNNTHESDWEMVQLVFDAPTVEDALLLDAPIQVGFAQHGGGELAEWGDEKLEKREGRPVVFPAAGSHGTYYGNELYIGWGENGTGFGCDNSTTPSSYVPLNVVVVPNEPDPNSDFGWLLYGGRWGELKSWEYSGPYGPNAGGKWTTPISSMTHWRDSSLNVPASRTIGPTATGLFCTLSEEGSQLLTRLWNDPAQLVTVVVAIVAAVALLFIVKRQELGEALGLYRRHFPVFLGIGATTIPIGIIYNGFSLLLRENPPMDWVVKWLNDTGGARLTVAAAVGGVQQLSMLLLIAPPVIVAIREIQAGGRPTILASFREGYRHLLTLATALALVFVAITMLVLLIVGIPIAIWLVVRWQFFGQATLLDHAESGSSAVMRSGNVVRGRWWQALGDSLVFQMFSLVPGPFIGVLLLLIGGAAVDFANAFSSVVFAITVPISIIGLTLAYQRYRSRIHPAPQPAGSTAAESPVNP